MKSFEYLERQRSLDRCVFRQLASRCRTINELSGTNRVLKEIIRAVVAVRTAKVTTGWVPVWGQIIHVADSAATAARAAARSLARYQDILLKKESLSAHWLWSCGLPWKSGSPRFGIERPVDPAAELAEVPAALRWEEGPAGSALEVRIWRGLGGPLGSMTQSFGYCAGSGELSGETYQAVFRRPWRTAARVRPPWNW